MAEKAQEVPAVEEDLASYEEIKHNSPAGEETVEKESKVNPLTKDQKYQMYMELTQNNPYKNPLDIWKCICLYETLGEEGFKKTFEKENKTVGEA